jgi:signal transduction histidine kinase/CheY-like chemotaxis protein
MPEDPTPTRTEKQADAGAAGFRELIEKTADGVLVVRPDGVIAYANPAEELLRRRAADLVGTMFGRPIGPVQVTEVDFAASGPTGPRVAEMRVVEAAWEGEPASLATLRDVTEREKAKKALLFLADAGSRLAASLDLPTTLETVAKLAVQHLADWCVIDLVDGPLDQPGEPPAAVRRRLAGGSGDPGKEALAKTLCGSYPLARADAGGVARAVRTGRMQVYPAPEEADLEALALEGRHTPTFRALGCRSALTAPMPARGKCIGAITFISSGGLHNYGREEQALAQDLADRAALAVANARLYDDAQEALRRRDEFLAMLAHELRNPLAPILHAAHLMKALGAGGGHIEQCRATIERQGRHLAHLLDDLLDLSRVMHGKIDLRVQPTDLKTVVEDAVQASATMVEGRKHRLEVSLKDDSLVVEGDPTRLAQVLENLLNNAAKHTPDGGRIDLVVCRAGGEAVVRVADNGEGIPEVMRARIFEPFTQLRQTLDRGEGGLGLGLAVVRRLVEMHGGRVAVVSSGPGRGSTFEVYLPLSRAPLPESDSGPVQPKTSRRVLLVEDNADGREMLAELLRLWGHEVETAGDGAAALERITGAPPDVALIDISLPGLDGYQLAQRVREIEAGKGVLLAAVTGYGLPEDRARAAAAGFDVHLVKPVSLARLARLLEGRGD